jgi:uncharacterized protein YdeI (YjbR/CyaY-like superfamily)
MRLMHRAGLEAFDRRKEEKTGIYSYEQRHSVRLDAAYEGEFRANKKAWGFFKDQAPSYRTAATYWVMSAKKEETRLRRLAKLIDDSAQGRRVPPLTPPPRKKVT